MRKSNVKFKLSEQPEFTFETVETCFSLKRSLYFRQFLNLCCLLYSFCTFKTIKPFQQQKKLFRDGLQNKNLKFGENALPLCFAMEEDEFKDPFFCQMKVST